MKPKKKEPKLEKKFDKTEQKILDDESVCQVNSDEEENPEEEQAQTLSVKEYKNMQKNFEEIEDMMCSICMDHMSVGETIIKTRCGIENLFPTSEESVLLKGHKFH